MKASQTKNSWKYSSTKKVNKKISKPTLPVYEHPGGKVKLIIKESLYQQIKFLCREIPNKEWSGLLVYQVTHGHISDPKNMIIEAKDIIFYDIGTGGATDHEVSRKNNQGQVDNARIDYDIEKGDGEDYLIGLIHSHNNMGVFFSGVDNEEMQENTPLHNFYLSLIVNNKMEMTAQIWTKSTFEVDIKEVNLTALDKDGNPYVLCTEDFSHKLERFYKILVDIEKPKESYQLDNFFLETYEKVKKENERYSYSPRYGSNYTTPTYSKTIGGTNNIYKPATSSFPQPSSGYSQVLDEDYYDAVESKYTVSDIEKFIVTLLEHDNTRGNNNNKSLDEVLFNLDHYKSTFTSQMISRWVLGNYKSKFIKAFGKLDKDEKNLIDAQVITLLEEEVQLHPYLDDLVIELKNKLSKNE